jgi:hypothetical protein
VEQLNNQSTVFFMMWRDGSWFGAFTADCRWLTPSSAVVAGRLAGGETVDLLVCGATWRPHDSDSRFSIGLIGAATASWRRGAEALERAVEVIDDCWRNGRRSYWAEFGWLLRSQQSPLSQQSTGRVGASMAVPILGLARLSFVKFLHENLAGGAMQTYCCYACRLPIQFCELSWRS